MQKSQSKSKWIRAIRGFFASLAVWRREEPGLVFNIVASSLVQGLSPFVNYYFMGRILSALLSRQAMPELMRLAVLTLAINFALGALGAWLSRRAGTQRNLSYISYLRILHGKLGRIPLEDYDSGAPRAVRDKLTGVTNFSGMGLTTAINWLADFCRGFFMIVGAVATSLTLFRLQAADPLFSALNHPLFSLGVLLLIFMLPVLGFYFTGKSQKFWVEASEKGTEGNRRLSYVVYTSDGIRSALERRLYCQDEMMLKWMQHDNVFLPNGFMHRLVKGKMAAPIVMSVVLPQLASGVACFYVILKALGGAFDLGQMSRYLASMLALVEGISLFVDGIGVNYNSSEFVEETLDYLALPEETGSEGLAMPERIEEIVVKNLSYAYPDSEKKALDEISVALEAGKRYALVGPNGSGKTTFIKLLLGFYRPSSGQIFLNGREIQDYSSHALHAIYTAIFQDFSLVAQPLGDNVAIAQPNTPSYEREEILEALRKAGFEVSGSYAAEGLDTYLYKDFKDTGVIPSGGEAQKIAIARALYKPAEVLVMDEPTAALDPMAESEIYERLDEIVEQRMALYVSHRLSSCKFCDEILVFEHGRIVQKGHHEELLKDTEGLYKKLWEAQAKHYQKA